VRRTRGFGDETAAGTTVVLKVIEAAGQALFIIWTGGMTPEFPGVLLAHMAVGLLQWGCSRFYRSHKAVNCFLENVYFFVLGSPYLRAAVNPFEV